MVVRLHINTLLICSFFLVELLTFHATALTFNLTNINAIDHSNLITTYAVANLTNQGIELTTTPNPNNGSSPFTRRAGRATYFEALHLWDRASGNMAGFKTHFSFVIDSNGSNSYADGLAFFLIPNASRALNILTGAACGLPVDIPPYNQRNATVAVEFDTYYNSPWDPPKVTTHVGIDVNSLNSSAAKEWSTNVPGGVKNEGWVRYNPSTKILKVFYTDNLGNSSRCKYNCFNISVDLREILPEYVAFGFSASTGAGFEKHYIKSWEFSSTSIDVAS